MIDVARRPIPGFEYGINKAGELVDDFREGMILGRPSHSSISPWVVDWNMDTKYKLERIEYLHGPHWQIDFAIDCWNSWQAGEWVEEAGDSSE